MKLTKLFTILTFGYLLASCAPRISRDITRAFPQRSCFSKVEVIDENKDLPENYVEVGRVNVRDRGLGLFCHYKQYVRIAKREARKAGGDVIVIMNDTGISLRSIFSMGENDNCHDLTVYILRKKDAALIFTYIPR